MSAEHHPALDAYVRCALWSSSHYPDETSEPVPFDDVDADFAPEALDQMNRDLSDFMEEAHEILEDYEDEGIGMSDDSIAHDFWLTRNGHGAGFWDRGLGEAGDRLTQAAKAWGSCDLYVGDDGQIYIV
jgi:hypothetical protein